MSKILNSILFTIVFLIISSCNKKERFLVKVHGQTMGTTYAVTINSDKKLESSKVKARLDKLLIDINRQMSTYQLDSEISIFNKKTKKGDWLEVSDDFVTVTKSAIEISKFTNNFFDPTIGPLVNLWGFGPKEVEAVPTEDEIARALESVGMGRIKLSNNRISKDHSALYLDYSAIAKGYGVDKVSQFLSSELGEKNHMVEIGGEIITKGTKNGAFWSIGIAAPSDKSLMAHKVVKMTNIAMATSGDYRNYIKKNGRQYAHTIDVKSGRPVQNRLASVTILDKTCMRADALATALMSMGFEKAKVFANEHKIPAYFIVRNLGKNKSEPFFEYANSSFLSLTGK